MQKHDGYVVIDLYYGQIQFNLTEEQAKERVEYFLEKGVRAENILVFEPNTNILFKQSVELKKSSQL